MTKDESGKLRERRTLPRPYIVAVDIQPNKSNGLTEPLYLQRVGNADTLKDARKLIADDIRQMSETYSGLISGVSIRGRTYRIFKAEWTEVEVSAHD